MSISKSFFLFFTAVCTPALWAQSNQQFSIGAVYSRFEYEEPNVMSEKGNLPGVYLQYSLATQNQFVWRFQGTYLNGGLNYDGAIYNTSTGVSTPATADTKDDVLQAQLDFGGQLGSATGSGGVGYFVGLAYRLWRDEIGGASGYRRHTTYYYLPIGLAFQGASSSYSYGFEIQYNLWIQGHNRSYLTDVNPTWDDYDFDQNEGRGYSLAFRMDFTRLFFKISYEHWDVENSTLQFFPANGSYLLEPKNNTDTYALTVGLLF